jgi:hypothetical protein
MDNGEMAGGNRAMAAEEQRSVAAKVQGRHGGFFVCDERAVRSCRWAGGYSRSGGLGGRFVSAKLPGHALPVPSHPRIPVSSPLAPGPSLHRPRGRMPLAHILAWHGRQSIAFLLLFLF